jgi:hypothetical protein
MIGLLCLALAVLTSPFKSKLPLSRVTAGLISFPSFGAYPVLTRPEKSKEANSRNTRLYWRTRHDSNV